MKLEWEKEKNPPGFQRFVAPDGSSAHPAGFEPTACRLGVLNLVLGLSSSEIVKALFFNAGSR